MLLALLLPYILCFFYSGRCGALCVSSGVKQTNLQQARSKACNVEACQRSEKGGGLQWPRYRIIGAGRWGVGVGKREGGLSTISETTVILQVLKLPK